MVQVEPSRAAGNRLSLRPHRLAQLCTANTRVSSKRLSLEIDQAGAAESARTQAVARVAQVEGLHATCCRRGASSTQQRRYSARYGRACRQALPITAEVMQCTWRPRSGVSALVESRGCKPLCPAAALCANTDTQRDPAARTVAASAAVRPRAAGTDVSGRPKRAGSPQCGWATAHAPRADVVLGARALVGLRRVHRSLDPRLGALRPMRWYPMRHGIP
jgi:hypothetical protein